MQDDTNSSIHVSTFNNNDYSFDKLFYVLFSIIWKLFIYFEKCFVVVATTPTI